MKMIVETMKRIIGNPFNHVAILFVIIGLVGLIVEPASATGWTGMILASVFMITIVEIATDFDE